MPLFSNKETKVVRILFIITRKGLSPDLKPAGQIPETLKNLFLKNGVLDSRLLKPICR